MYVFLSPKIIRTGMAFPCRGTAQHKLTVLSGTTQSCLVGKHSAGKATGVSITFVQYSSEKGGGAIKTS